LYDYITTQLLFNFSLSLSLSLSKFSRDVIFCIRFFFSLLLQKISSAKYVKNFPGGGLKLREKVYERTRGLSIISSANTQKLPPLVIRFNHAKHSERY
jgi:hypothetical protein